MPRKPEMLQKAKHESEILLHEALNSAYDGVNVPGYGNVKFKFPVHIDEHMKIFDTSYHIDNVVEALYEDGTHQAWFFDVKDVTDESLKHHSKNYTIPADPDDPSNQFNFFKTSKDEHWIAFRKNDGTRRLDKFYVVYAHDICNKCNIKNFRDKYYLISLDDILSCKRMFEIERDF